VAGPASVAQALAVLAGVVAVHEAGHFSAAVSRGVRVSAFSIGFGPALLSRVGDDGVDYSLRAIPLGGYVAFPDDDPESDVPADDPDLLKNRPLADRAAVISAGVAANLVSAAVVLLVQAGTVGVAVLDASPGVTVPRVLDGSAAAAAGLRSGDVVLAMDGVPIPPAGVDDAVARVRAAAGRQMTLTGVRGPDATPFTVRVVPSPALDGSGGRIGVQLATRGVVTHRVAKGPVAIVRTAAAEYARLGGAVLAGLKGLVTNFGDAASRLAGPVAIVAAGAEVARADGAGLFQFAAIVNINLAVVNLLPLPALDGGYLALLAVEAVRGGVKLPKEVEQTIMASGLLLLMAAGAVLLVRDTLTLSGLAGG
jgi:membrane-associated protease RseP (regulator of RpoE activity)